MWKESREGFDTELYKNYKHAIIVESTLFIASVAEYLRKILLAAREEKDDSIDPDFVKNIF